EPLILSYKITGAAQDDTMKKMFLFGQQQNNVGGGTIESIDVVPIACIRNVVANNDKEQDIGVPNSEDIERRLSYDERPEEGDEFCSKDKHLISKKLMGKVVNILQKESRC
ncbi:hypothetical protein HAX54_042796, partial [Datura stramonium]|nr:hypothetical protein [Datura stramonium]